jgi:hypothetical protein
MTPMEPRTSSFTNAAELPSLRKSQEFEQCLLHGSGRGLYQDRSAASGLRGGETGYSFGVAVHRASRNHAPR